MWNAMNPNPYPPGHPWHGRGLAARVGPFSITLPCFSTVFMSGEAKDLDQADKVILPESVLHELMRNPETQLPHPVMFRLEHVKYGTTSHCGVLEFSAFEQKCYMPNWMKENLLLNDGDQVKFTLVPNLPKLNFVRFKPATYAFSQLPDAKTTLEHCLQRFTCLTLNDTIQIKHQGQTFRLTVDECKPCEGDRPAGCIVDTNLTVDFGEPIDKEKGKPKEARRIEIDDEIADSVPAEQTRYFKVRRQEADSMAARITIHALAGETVMFVSSTVTEPNVSKSTWRAMSREATQVVTVEPGHRDVRGNWLYIAVSGYKSATQFTLKVEEVEPDSNSGLSSRSGGHALGHSGASASSGADDPNTTLCGNCRKWIPIQSYQMHTLRCARSNWACSECDKVMPQSEKASHAHCPKCGDVVAPEDMEKHIALVHAKKRCVCGLEFEPEELDIHQREECPFRSVNCKYCTLAIPFNQKREHEKLCGNKTIECPLCGDSVVRKNMVIHNACNHGIDPTKRSDGTTGTYSSDLHAAATLSHHAPQQPSAMDVDSSSSSSASSSGARGGADRGFEAVMAASRQEQEDRMLQEALAASMGTSAASTSSSSPSSSSTTPPPVVVGETHDFPCVYCQKFIPVSTDMETHLESCASSR